MAKLATILILLIISHLGFSQNVKLNSGNVCINNSISYNETKNIVLNEFIMDRWSTAFDSGGCSDFRTSKSDEEEHLKLAKKYPYVQITNKYQDLKHIGRLRVFKTDIRSAYKSSQVGTLKEFL